MYKTISLKKGKEASILRKHPWIFSGAVREDLNQYIDGEILDVLDVKGNYLGTGHFQHGSICVRLLTFTQNQIDENFFRERFENALDLRKNKLNLLNSDNNIFRLVHAEGDGLPGLIVDYYNGVCVIQAHSIGMYLQENAICEALKGVFNKDLKAIYSKSSETLPERLKSVNQYLYGSCDVPHLCLENGNKYAIDWISGQKTGFFIDQRENRSLLGDFSAGKTVLNTFCYSGGFSVGALQSGAEQVTSVDSSNRAIELTDRNIQLNDLQNKHESIVADAVTFLDNLSDFYDVIVLDPPAFAKKKDKRHNAIKAYKRINACAMRQIKKGGILFTFSCSQVVDKYLFNHTITAAAIEAGREVRILHQLHQPADHPINIYHPEGEYLKGLVLEVI